jgi:hypothetical protein
MADALVASVWAAEPCLNLRLNRRGRGPLRPLKQSGGPRRSRVNLTLYCVAWSVRFPWKVDWPSDDAMRSVRLASIFLVLPAALTLNLFGQVVGQGLFSKVAGSYTAEYLPKVTFASSSQLPTPRRFKPRAMTSVRF